MPNTSPEFDRRYKELNKAQKTAVDAIEGPVMVIAGPGTGKTTILTLRIANILKQTDTPASGILAITYTDAGVRAMRAKLQNIIGDRAHDVQICTFHGFASAVIAEYPDHFIRIGEMEQMTDIEQESMIRSIIEEPKFADLRPAGRPDAYISAILRSIDDSKREALSPEMVRQHAEKCIENIKNDEASISTRGITKGQLKAEAKEEIQKCEKTKIFADVYAEYETRKNAAKQMDFNDLIIELLLALRNDELLLRLLQERYLYLHVDEHQDTNDAQNFIVSMIAEFFDTPNIFIVGDEKQAIYRFQGASVENFLLLQKHWPAMKVISLDTNYRSHQDILDSAFQMIEKNYEGDEHKDLRVELKGGATISDGDLDVGGTAGKTSVKPLNILIGENVAGMEKALVDELRGFLKKNKKDETVAIIVRRNADLDRVIRLLESHDIPVSSERSVDIFNHPVGRLFFGLIEFLVDPSCVEGLATTITAGMWNLSFEKGIEVIRALKSGKGSQLEKDIPELLHIRRTMLNDGAVGFLTNVAQESGFIDLLARDPAYIHVWRGIVSLAESLARDRNIRDPQELIRGLLAYKASAERRPIKVSIGAPDVPIKAMTAHGSKGLEFDRVFIPYATEESWVGRHRGSSFILPRKRTNDSDIRDVRRLFYVAVTRARKSVFILSALQESDGGLLSPVRFIDELGVEEKDKVILPRVTVDVMQNVRQTHENTRLADIAKQTLVTSGLSVTALNHFLKCPNAFIFQSILKLPQAPSVSAEKGTAMHEAIACVWSIAPVSGIDIEKKLVESINAHFETSFLSSFDIQNTKKDLLEDAPITAKALESHFALKTKGTEVLTETWLRTEFAGSYNGSTITIPIHGKLDALLDDGRAVSIYDYKTKKAMSVNAIKGETKDATGDYFRQLIFYKILSAGDRRWRSKPVTPALVFVTPDDKGRCPTITLPIEPADIDRVKGEIIKLIDSVWSGKIATASCGDVDCEWCGLRNLTTEAKK